jgi:hypothetical protein
LQVIRYYLFLCCRKLASWVFHTGTSLSIMLSILILLRYINLEWDLVLNFLILSLGCSVALLGLGYLILPRTKG